ncbi:hypothetical protein O181_132021 [Austropuccinia psidii MF-1]|uniref:Uncharacterized protein n=1 Tax=Austropuccinia psidii MF-1 TaxID=1389203 RepID=A0A9Q3L580_9BASI|nr:hypothetical protein [Austropuccinia psidii MF-1]
METETPPVQNDDHKPILEEVSLLSPWRIHPNIGYRKEGLPSEQFKFIMEISSHPTATPGRHEKINEEGSYSSKQDEVNI